MERNVGGTESAITMCLVQGARIQHHNMTTITTRSQLTCKSVCSMHSDCKSINFHLVYRTCDINDEAATSYKAVLDFDNQLSVDYIYAVQLSADLHVRENICIFSPIKT